MRAHALLYDVVLTKYIFNDLKKIFFFRMFLQNFVFFFVQAKDRHMVQFGYKLVLDINICFSEIIPNFILTYLPWLLFLSGEFFRSVFSNKKMLFFCYYYLLFFSKFFAKQNQILFLTLICVLLKVFLLFCYCHL